MNHRVQPDRLVSLTFVALLLLLTLPMLSPADPPPRMFQGQQAGPAESAAVPPAEGKKLFVQEESRLQDRWGAAKVVFSPDGSLLVRLAGWEMTIWDISRGDPKEVSVISTRERKMQSVESAAFSPDGSLLALGGEDKSVRLFSYDHAGTLTELSAATEHDGTVQCLQFNSKGNLLVSGGDDMALFLWSVDKGQLNQVGIYKIEGAIFGIKHLAFVAQRPTVIVTCGDGTVTTLDIADNSFKPRSTTKLPADFMLPVAVSPAGDKLVFGSKIDVRVWDRQSKLAFHIHTGRVVSVAWSPDGKAFASVGDDGRLVVWSADAKVRYQLLRPKKFNWVAFCPAQDKNGAYTLACANDNGIIYLIRLGDVPKGIKPAAPTVPAGNPSALHRVLPTDIEIWARLLLHSACAQSAAA